MKTYISLFSSAGVGCFGFKEKGFECVATNELIERRLDVQRANKKCKYETGYICGDITSESTVEKLYSEIELWKSKEKLKKVDVVIATPPCQGMSVANHKKKDSEIVRNSLVVESIKLITKIKPKFFVFENVPAFMKTPCTDIDGLDKPISEAIEKNLGPFYSYAARVINFKNYGACSSRQRTLVIGVANEYSDDISPFELFPDFVRESTLRETIGDLKSFQTMGEIDPNDIYHFFRPYPEHMREWISDLKEGQSAFENEDEKKKPHKIIDGKIVINQNKNSDKYTRTFWEKVGPCVHTRNDQLASQNTIHPSDDRVFSIRELMRLMSIPDSFKWVEDDVQTLNKKSIEEKRQFLKINEIKIRQSLGEAVPTAIFSSIAGKISEAMDCVFVKKGDIKKIIAEYGCDNPDTLIDFIEKNELNLSVASLSRIAEYANANRVDDAAFYTNKSLITEIVKFLPDTEHGEISILEPSVGVGNFLPIILKRFEDKKIIFDIVDIDENSLNITKALLKKMPYIKNCTFNFVNDDFLLHKFDKTYDYIIGNPPFGKITEDTKLMRIYKKDAINRKTNNISSFFLDKTINLGKYISLVFPKSILNTPEFSATRKYLQEMNVFGIIDFGEKGFPGVLIETIALFINTTKKANKTKVKSFVDKFELTQNQTYIFDEKLPYWIIYRNEQFDAVLSKMRFDVFDVFRDRQIVNGLLSSNKNDIRVIKSKNICDDGRIINIDGYDSYITDQNLKDLAVNNFIDNDEVYLTPNMTYYPRVIKKPKNSVVNGSVAILIPKENIKLTKEQMCYFSSKEYRDFYWIARNHQTRSLNIDACSVYFFGILNNKIG